MPKAQAAVGDRAVRSGIGDPARIESTVEFVGDGTEESAHTVAVVADVGFAGAANCKNGYLSHASDDPRQF
ncbi:hypothetical protein rerp_40360 [Rhodococcus erythropolis]|nr:hypothetical protein rerp_40360 [Rhodococcus erythropolis]